ncbi:M23 family metallopeptidase [Chitinilyticum litopenaei]|uniref:M23 family metallopeptidase n=1 Tax=Chitinilyticum litopenaei TaxID=1121276 RepID=UPI00040F3852|nr:M23 family metallopeptidase [Chitinilyticum litopenaei]
MDVIVVSNRLAKAVSLDGRQLLLLALPCLALLLTAGFLAGRYWSVRTVQQQAALSPADRATLDALAGQVGELHARLTRMNQLAVEVGSKTGLDVQPFLGEASAPRGGVFRTQGVPSLAELSGALAQSRDESQGYLDVLTVAHSLLLQPKTSELPVHAPIGSGMQTSSFGWRSDPFRGSPAFHEGLDFSAPTGTAIQAAADGVVKFAGWHAQYGNMVDLDHGRGMSSRYAHASELLVREGQAVKVGQEIARVGSTGRSTGPHLHFEIRFMGVAQNPLRFVAPDVLLAASP